jgi:hypothetical protein
MLALTRAGRACASRISIPRGREVLSHAERHKDHRTCHHQTYSNFLPHRPISLLILPMQSFTGLEAAHRDSNQLGLSR